MKGIRLMAAAGFFSFLTLAADSIVAIAQIDSTEFVNRSQRQQPVSKNQLLIPGKAWKAIDRARENLVRGDLVSAQKEIARALEIAPHCAFALAVQGTLDLKMGHPERAADSFQKAIDNDPAQGLAYLGLATILITERRYKEALAPLDRAAGLLPTSWYVHFQAGLAQLGLGNVEAARKEAEVAQGLTGTDPEEGSGVSYLHAMVSAKMRDLAGTRKYLADAVTQSPHGYYAEHARGWLERLQVDLANNRYVLPATGSAQPPAEWAQGVSAIPSGTQIGSPSATASAGVALWPISTHVPRVGLCIDVPANTAARRCTGTDCLIAPLP